uniref:hypothetical protein n=1 Tax=Janibacter limosus TaxID=53458 RepID=UPI0035DEAB3E
MFTMLLSGDLMVADADRMAQLLVDKVGITGHPNWRRAFPGHPYVAHFLRTHKSLAVAPTRVEPQGHLDADNPGDPMFPIYLHSLEELQGVTRPIKTHATVLITDDLKGVTQRLHERRVPFRPARRTPEMPFDRLWVGCLPRGPALHTRGGRRAVHRDHGPGALANARRRLPDAGGGASRPRTQRPRPGRRARVPGPRPR